MQPSSGLPAGPAHNNHSAGGAFPVHRSMAGFPMARDHSKD